MKLPLNKTSLTQQRNQLQTFARFLPSLDLKRQQLIAEYQRARAVLAATDDEIDQLMASSQALFALMGARDLDLTGLVSVQAKQTREENLLGVRLPVFVEVQFHSVDYSTLAKPFWVDFLVNLLKKMTALTVRRQIEGDRVARLNEAVRRITQRVNLFEKVLIPQTRENIQRIRIFLDDTARAAVVRSKIAKAKQQQKPRVNVTQ